MNYKNSFVFICYCTEYAIHCIAKSKLKSQWDPRVAIDTNCSRSNNNNNNNNNNNYNNYKFHILVNKQFKLMDVSHTWSVYTTLMFNVLLAVVVVVLFLHFWSPHRKEENLSFGKAPEHTIYNKELFLVSDSLTRW